MPVQVAKHQAVLQLYTMRDICRVAGLVMVAGPITSQSTTPPQVGRNAGRKPFEWRPL